MEIIINYNKAYKYILEKILDLKIFLIKDYNNKYLDFFTNKMTDYFVDYSDLDEYIEYNIINSINKFELLELIKNYLYKNNISFNFEKNKDYSCLYIEYDNKKYTQKNPRLTELEMFLNFIYLTYCRD